MKEFKHLVNTPSFSADLPADESESAMSRQVFKACFSHILPIRPSSPELLHHSTELASDLGFKINDLDNFTQIVSGTIQFPNALPYAMCYGGHQFGNWAGQLGDGRAINIAELDVKEGNWKLQLKGAGPTPYSRRSDGLAVLRSSIREYLCSEAMHHLGVPTTRALSLVKTGDLVPRDILYNGNVKEELGAIVCRTAPSFIRFGSFEIFTSRNELEVLKQLVDFTIKRHYPSLPAPSKETYIQFFEEVVNKTREMIIHWQRVGFVHGVMNTDNMSILGLTIDYGPYGWLENYDPNWTPNTTDIQHKRYRFGNQASIALWNLTQLANAIYPLIEEAKPLQDILESYKTEYLDNYHLMMLNKLGLYDQEIAQSFVAELENQLEESEIDMTIFFRLISNRSALIDFDHFQEVLGRSSYLDISQSDSNWEVWFQEYKALVDKEAISSEKREENMKTVNPKYVLRNYMAQLAIEDAEKGNYKLLEELYQLLLKPYDEQPEMEKWFAKRPDWAKSKVGCSMLSCSS